MGLAFRDCAGLAFLNFIGLGVTGRRFTLGALAAVREWALGRVYLDFAASGDVIPRAMTKVKSSALNFIRPF